MGPERITRPKILQAIFTIIIIMCIHSIQFQIQISNGVKVNTDPSTSFTNPEDDPPSPPYHLNPCFLQA